MTSFSGGFPIASANCNGPTFAADHSIRYQISHKFQGNWQFSMEKLEEITNDSNQLTTDQHPHKAHRPESSRVSPNGNWLFMGDGHEVFLINYDCILIVNNFEQLSPTNWRFSLVLIYDATTTTMTRQQRWWWWRRRSIVMAITGNESESLSMLLGKGWPNTSL